MKKILLLSCLILLSTKLLGNHSEGCHSCWSSSFSAGYVFKNDSKFKDVYGHGVINALTADICYYPWKCWGLGSKISYWRKKGRTAFLQLRSIIQEVPITFYLRRIKEFNCGLIAYASLGGGLIWLKEKSYLGKVLFHKGIGELEAALEYPIWRCITILGAFRYLFPPRSRSCENVVLGGFDLRAGIGFSF